MNIIGELNIFLDRAEKAKGNDESLAVLLSDLKHKYDIPDSIAELESWEEKTPEADRIIKTYRFILSLRSV